MFDYSDFMQVFPAGAQLPYDREQLSDIDVSRKQFDGILFIDRVLKALAIKGKGYPPKSDSALRNLHQQICQAGMSLHHKFSLLYYILLDFDEASSHVNASEAFATASGMPRNYQIFMKGLWFLDQQEFSKAIEYVTHPSLVPDFPDEILTVLLRHAADTTLGLSYYTTVRPILKTTTALELLFDAMAYSNITEALLFSRTFPEYTREALFRRLVTAALDEKAPAEAGELASLSFEVEEEAWFEDFLTHGDGKALWRAKDTLLIRKIVGDRFADACKHKSTGQWGPILDGIRAGTEGLE